MIISIRTDPCPDLPLRKEIPSHLSQSGVSSCACLKELDPHKPSLEERKAYRKNDPSVSVLVPSHKPKDWNPSPLMGSSEYQTIGHHLSISTHLRDSSNSRKDDHLYVTRGYFHSTLFTISSSIEPIPPYRHFYTQRRHLEGKRILPCYVHK